MKRIVSIGFSSYVTLTVLIVVSTIPSVSVHTGTIPMLTRIILLLFTSSAVFIHGTYSKKYLITGTKNEKFYRIDQLSFIPMVIISLLMFNVKTNITLYITLFLEVNLIHIIPIAFWVEQEH